MPSRSKAVLVKSTQAPSAETMGSCELPAPVPLGVSKAADTRAAVPVVRSKR